MRSGHTFFASLHATVMLDGALAEKGCFGRSLVRVWRGDVDLGRQSKLSPYRPHAGHRNSVDSPMFHDGKNL
jgi:hypothetical protein